MERSVRVGPAIPHPRVAGFCGFADREIKDERRVGISRFARDSASSDVPRLKEAGEGRGGGGGGRERAVSVSGINPRVERLSRQAESQNRASGRFALNRDRQTRGEGEGVGGAPPASAPVGHFPSPFKPRLYVNSAVIPRVFHPLLAPAIPAPVLSLPPSSGVNRAITRRDQVTP